MLNQIANIFQQASDVTRLVERYEGVVQRVTIQIQGKNGLVSETVPVSCTDPTACENERYRKAMPDQALRGLSYVEQRGPATIGPFDNFGYTVTYPVRFVLWVNIGKQGLENCGDTITHAELKIINCLRHEKTVSPSWSSQPITATLNDFSITPKIPGQIFQGFAYNDKQALYFWPFAYTAITCNATFQIPANCIAAMPVNTVEECVTV